MEPNIELTKGNWLLVVGSRKVLPTLLKMTMRLAETGSSAPHGAETADGGLRPPRPAVRVVDAGLLYYPFQLERAASNDPKVMEQIKVSYVNSCRQLLDILDCMVASPEPFIVLNLLNMFFDPFIWIDERKRILSGCLANLDRLARKSGGLVSVHPPSILSQAEKELMEMVSGAARDTYHVEMAQGPVPVRAI